MLYFFSNFLFVSVEHRSCKQSAIYFFPVNTDKEKEKKKNSFTGR